MAGRRNRRHHEQMGAASSTMAYMVATRVHVAVHSQASPSNREWDAYLAHIERSLQVVDGIYSFSHGGGPDAGQRAASVAFWKRQPRSLPIAVITPSMLVVRMAGALRWFMPGQIKAFLPRDVLGASDYLGLGASQRRAVNEAIGLLFARLPGSNGSG